MRRISFLLLAIIFIGVVSGCKKDDDPGPSEEDLRKEALTATWLVSSVSLDGDDFTSDWTGFTLTITTSTSNGYQTENSFNEDVWPQSGSWRFQTVDGVQNLDVILRDATLPIDIISVTETGLNLSFRFGEDPSSRVKNVDGIWDFNFTKQ